MPVIEKFFKSKEPMYGSWVPEHCVAADLAAQKLVFMGESHGKECIIKQ